MASRPPHTSKSDNTAKPSASPGQTPGGDLDASTVIDDSSLQRRELPSYSDTREARIAERAYWRAERRGFVPGRELDDWLEAEREVDADEKSAQGDG